jgi:hypothetical protein
MCRIGGEVEASIFHSFSNKYHDGFIGHSYVGKWVNIAAGAQVSDLRHDYGPVRVRIGSRRVNTGLTKVGAFLGDHTKVGLGALLNTGSVYGAFCNVLPSGTYLPRWTPAFCRIESGHIHEHSDLHSLLITATEVMHRRGCELTVAYAALVHALFDHTAAVRAEAIHADQLRLLRRAA